MPTMSGERRCQCLASCGILHCKTCYVLHGRSDATWQCKCPKMVILQATSVDRKGSVICIAIDIEMAESRSWGQNCMHGH